MIPQQLNMLNLGVGALQIQEATADSSDWCWLFNDSEMCRKCMQEKSNYFECVCFDPLQDVTMYPKMAAAIWRRGSGDPGLLG